jgi:hypothetical protein
METYKMTDVYTGGGCDHLLIEFEGYSIFFVVNNNDCNIPKHGEDWGFCSYLSEDDMNNGKYVDCIGPLENFSYANLKSFLQGFIAAKGYKKDSQNFNLKDVDFMQLTLDIHEKCEPHVMIEVFYNYLKTLSKEDLLLGLTTWIDGEQLDIFNYVQKEN